MTVHIPAFEAFDRLVPWPEVLSVIFALDVIALAEDAYINEFVLSAAPEPVPPLLTGRTPLTPMIRDGNL